MQRWLADLERAGLIAVDGERDNRGQWWRTVITLLDAPQPDRRHRACTRFAWYRTTANRGVDRA